MEVLKVLSVEQIVSFIVYGIGLVSFFFNLKSKTEKNSIMISQIQEKLEDEIDLNRKNISKIEETNKQDYNSLKAEITALKDDFQPKFETVISEMGEIKGMLKIHLKQD